jgi:hypothetical protein
VPGAPAGQGARVAAPLGAAILSLTSPLMLRPNDRYGWLVTIMGGDVP